MQFRRRWLTSIALAVLIAALGIPLARVQSPSTAVDGTLVATLVEASDIHSDGTTPSHASNMRATSDLAIAQSPDAVLIAGDHTTSGTTSQFQGYNTYWGRLKSITLSAPGNHDYSQANAQPWRDYFGYTQSYNSRDVKGVHLIALDVGVGGASASSGSTQYQWLQSDLAAHRGMPVFAFWHVPRYSTGAAHGDSTTPTAVWNLLQSYGAELVFSGHDHTYQRFPKANGDGTLNPTSGIREIISATGGSGNLYGWGSSVLTPEYRQNTTEGVTRIKVYTDHLEWAFLGVNGTTMDSGSQPLTHPVGQPTSPPTTTTPPATNQAPTVSAGADATVAMPVAATLTGTAHDDGLPNPPATMTTTWSKVSGPGTVTFGNPAAVSTTATFSAQGSYVLRLTASDSALTSTDEVTVTVTAPTASPTPTPTPAAKTADRRVATRADDAEQFVSGGRTGTTIIKGNDLELVVDSSRVQRVGLRFANLQVPHGATVTNAWVEFTAKSGGSGSISLTLNGEASDSAAGYAATRNNLTNRALTAASVPWTAGSWTAGSRYRTPNVAALVQEIVDRAGWGAGNALALQVSGTSGTRNAYSYDGIAASAPLLHVEFTV